MAEQYIKSSNGAAAVRLEEIPLLAYTDFYALLDELLDREEIHLAHYFALPEREERLRFIALILNDVTSEVWITSHAMEYYEDGELRSLTARHEEVHPFEREIWERYGVRFAQMPWLKPLRFPFDRFNARSTMDNYPFYTMEGESLHEVNVGPIHAGIIEPGAFRFICNGEQVLHLEIALGYQHRGVEHALASTQNRLRQVMLSESVAGDSAIAHSTAFSMALECAAAEPYVGSEQLDVERFVALELERMAMQIADTGALSMDIGYQLGQVACEALRTVTINTTQAWCGNRFGKGLIRPFGTNFPLTRAKVEMILKNVEEVRRRYQEVVEDIRTSPTILARFEQCGVVLRQEMVRIGGVGQAARASGLQRDLRVSHPWGEFKRMAHESVVEKDGDVMARLMVRAREVAQSAEAILEHLRRLLPTLQEGAGSSVRPDFERKLRGGVLSFALVEGWRGEICTVVVTDSQGELSTVKVKDPSLHNWLALALAVRGEGISDFPICNKSFNLSYCGNDL